MIDCIQHVFSLHLVQSNKKLFAKVTAAILIIHYLSDKQAHIITEPCTQEAGIRIKTFIE